MSRRRRVLLVLCGLLETACPAPRGAARNAILISIDTLRADHLEVYGHERPTSPNLDAFAAGGVVFEDPLATAAWTLPSHISLLTGRYPAGHGVRKDRHRLRGNVPTLASVLQERGFATAAFVNSFFLQPSYGAQRGFATYRYVPESDSRRGDAPLITRLALDWLGARRDGRFFLFLHYFDVHSDYVALERYEQIFAPRPGRLSGRTQELMRIRAKQLSIAPEDAEHLARLYDAGIRQLDDDLEPLFEWLQESGRFGDTVVIVTSDHGEEFLEHGSVSHDRTHYQELLRVPLILGGGGLPAGLRIATPVSLTDLMPTLLGLLELPAPVGIDGRDLRALWESPEPAADERPLFAETSPMREDALRSVRMGRFKLIRDLRTDRVELYDLEADPVETRDLSAALPEVVDRLSSVLDDLLRRSVEPEPLSELPKEAEARLRALGYL